MKIDSYMYMKCIVTNTYSSRASGGCVFSQSFRNVPTTFALLKKRHMLQNQSRLKKYSTFK